MLKSTYFSKRGYEIIEHFNAAVNFNKQHTIHADAHQDSKWQARWWQLAMIKLNFAIFNEIQDGGPQVI